jgi:hypothetical protein
MPPSSPFSGFTPFSSDLDSLLKRLLDALSQTIFSAVPARTRAVSLEATEVPAKIGLSLLFGVPYIYSILAIAALVFIGHFVRLDDQTGGGGYPARTAACVSGDQANRSVSHCR